MLKQKLVCSHSMFILSLFSCCLFVVSLNGMNFMSHFMQPYVSWTSAFCWAGVSSVSSSSDTHLSCYLWCWRPLHIVNPGLQLFYQWMISLSLAGLSTERRSASWMKWKSSLVFAPIDCNVSSTIFKIEAGRSGNTFAMMRCMQLYWPSSLSGYTNVNNGQITMTA